MHDVYGVGLPADIVEVPLATWETYAGAPPLGMMRGTDGTNPIWTPVPTPQPTLQQQAAAMMREPVTVTSTSNPALDGSYPLDPTTQQQITSIASAINAGMGLPGGQTTFNWPDASNNSHAWDATSFIAYAKGLLDFLYSCSQVAQGRATTLPAQTITIP
jgi:hypothetical protein